MNIPEYTIIITDNTYHINFHIDLTKTPVYMFK